jgi:GNAT superfamily N-acetyltransferase
MHPSLPVARAPQQLARGVAPAGADLLPRRLGRWDVAALVGMHERCSAAALRSRYFVSVGPGEIATRPALLEPPDGLALGFFADAELVAAGQLAGGVAAVPEIALLVTDAWQNQGLGGRLLAALLRVAAEAGHDEVSLAIAGRNRAMWRVVSRDTAVVRVRYEAGFGEVRVATGRPM